MLGAIIGDMVGSPFEFDRRADQKQTAFPLFGPESDYTDDTVMTLAVGQALLEAGGDESGADQALIAAMRGFARVYPLPKGGYGARFSRWLWAENPAPYGSWGNGSAMRVSAVGWLFDTLDDVEHWAEITARVTHNHPEGIKGAQATAAAIFLARSGAAKEDIKAYVSHRFGYDLTRTLDEIRPTYHHVESCQETVPEAITAFLESQGFEDAIRRAVSLGGDADTLTDITGAIAEAAYGVPEPIRREALTRLPDDFVALLERFWTRVAARRGRTDGS